MCANALFFIHLVSLCVTLRMEGVTTTAAVLGMRRRVLVAVGLGGHPSLLLPVVPLAGVWGYPLAVSPRSPVPCTFPARMLPHACVAPVQRFCAPIAFAVAVARGPDGTIGPRVCWSCSFCFCRACRAVFEAPPACRGPPLPMHRANGDCYCGGRALLTATPPRRDAAAA